MVSAVQLKTLFEHNTTKKKGLQLKSVINQFVNNVENTQP